jgi:hypothetical protein
MWYGDNYLDLDTRYFRRLLLGLCFWDLVAMFVNSIMVPNTVLSLWWGMRCRDTLSLSTDQEPRGSLCKTTSSIQRRPFSKGIHVTTLATPSLSSPDLRYRFRLTYPDYPRLTWSQCLQWSLWHGLCVSTLNFPNIPTGSNAFNVGLRSRWQHSMAGKLSAVCRLEAPGSTWYTSQGADTKIIIDTNSDPKSRHIKSLQKASMMNQRPSETFSLPGLPHSILKATSTGAGNGIYAGKILSHHHRSHLGRFQLCPSFNQT